MRNAWVGESLPAPSLTPPPAAAPARKDYAGSATCRGCHEAAYLAWEGSHHAQAERPLEFLRDRDAFDPAATIAHGSQISGARYANRRFELTTLGAQGVAETFVVERVIGVNPLKQFLIPAAGGRYQVGELAVDTMRGDWFDVYGLEDRKPGEWGHWTGRGMNWNSMCAACHNTGLRKNYRPEEDRYETTMAEMGVGCEACHGPMADHVAWQQSRPQPATNDPTVRRIARDRQLDTCGSCHARRGELTDEFSPGEAFGDHYALTVPDESDVFYPDGQVRDEDFEFMPFLASRMHAAGVRCWDCHDVHSGKTLLAGDALCLKCHGPPVAPAPRIESARHTFHKPGTPGDACVDCHMPQTTYMQRHPRRDHGFTSPDPLLTQELGIPNACTRCHSDRSVEWAIEWADRWYGARMDRPARQRTRVIGAARNGQRAVLPRLMEIAGGDPIPLWRGVAAGLLRRWAHEPAVLGVLLQGTRDTNSLVRALAVRSLDVLGAGMPEGVRAAAARLWDDPVREVRVAAAWLLRAGLATNTVAGMDLLRSLRVTADQPGGQLQLGVYALDRGDLPGALAAFERAVSWDGGSPPLREAWAVALASAGRIHDAIRELRVAGRLAPRHGDYRYKLGLALHEAGQPREGNEALEEAVRLDPEHPRAWYNLGLARSAAGRSEEAVAALLRAEQLNPTDPQVPYARATIHARLGQMGEARTAAERALELAPGFAAAQELLRGLR